MIKNKIRNIALTFSFMSTGALFNELGFMVFISFILVSLLVSIVGGLGFSWIEERLERKYEQQ